MSCIFALDQWLSLLVFSESSQENTLLSIRCHCTIYSISLIFRSPYLQCMESSVQFSEDPLRLASFWNPAKLDIQHSSIILAYYDTPNFHYFYKFNMECSSCTFPGISRREIWPNYRSSLTPYPLLSASFCYLRHIQSVWSWLMLFLHVQGQYIEVYSLFSLSIAN